MPKSTPRILAIDPGTRRMGVAFLEGNRLRYHGVEVLPGTDSPHDSVTAGRVAVLRLIKDLRPTVLAIEKTFITTNKRFALLNVLADDIISLARRRRMRIVAVAPVTVKKQVTGNGHADKQAVSAAVARVFPELAVYLSQDRKWKARHHANMFDAVAVGLTARDRL